MQADNVQNDIQLQNGIRNFKISAFFLLGVILGWKNSMRHEVPAIVNLAVITYLFFRFGPQEGTAAGLGLAVGTLFHAVFPSQMPRLEIKPLIQSI